MLLREFWRIRFLTWKKTALEPLSRILGLSCVLDVIQLSNLCWRSLVFVVFLLAPLSPLLSVSLLTVSFTRCDFTVRKPHAHPPISALVLLRPSDVSLPLSLSAEGTDYFCLKLCHALMGFTVHPMYILSARIMRARQ